MMHPRMSRSLMYAIIRCVLFKILQDGHRSLLNKHNVGLIPQVIMITADWKNVCGEENMFLYLIL